jgi:hypothetical protein
VVIVDHHQRVAVGRRLGEGGGGDQTPCAGPRLHDERLAEPRRHLLADDARYRVEQSARREADQQPDRFVRVARVLRAGARSHAQGERERGAGCDDRSWHVRFPI